MDRASNYSDDEPTFVEGSGIGSDRLPQFNVSLGGLSGVGIRRRDAGVGRQGPRTERETLESGLLHFIVLILTILLLFPSLQDHIGGLGGV